MDQKRAKLQGLIAALILSGCSAVVVVGSGSINVEDHEKKNAEIESDEAIDVDLYP